MADGSPSSPQGDLKDAIKQNAAGPKQARADGVNVQQHALDDQVAADKYLGGKEAVSKNSAKAFVRVRIVPPGRA